MSKKCKVVVDTLMGLSTTEKRYKDSWNCVRRGGRPELPARVTQRSPGAICALVFTCIFLFGNADIAGAQVKQSDAVPQEEAGSPEKSGLKATLSMGPSDEPVYIKSDSLSLDSKSRVFTYEDNVEVVRGELSITCDRVIGTYDENNELQKVVCEDNVVVTKGPALRASANRAVYTLSKKTIELTEAPELAREGNILFADKITIFVEEDRSEAEGNVRVKVIKPEDEGNELPTQKVLKAKKKSTADTSDDSDFE